MKCQSPRQLAAAILAGGGPAEGGSLEAIAGNSSYMLAFYLRLRDTARADRSRGLVHRLQGAPAQFRTSLKAAIAKEVEGDEGCGVTAKAVFTVVLGGITVAGVVNAVSRIARGESILQVLGMEARDGSTVLAMSGLILHLAVLTLLICALRKAITRRRRWRKIAAAL